MVFKNVILSTALIFSTQALEGEDWMPCTKQNCQSAGWICCDTTTQDKDAGTAEFTGVMLCTDPNRKGIVPDSSEDFAGMTYHCSHQQHKDYLISADESSKLLFGASVTAGSILYVLLA